MVAFTTIYAFLMNVIKIIIKIKTKWPVPVVTNFSYGGYVLLQDQRQQS